MTENDFDRTARLWLQDGPSQLADRVLEAALDEIHATRQRRAWWPARRFPSMGNVMRLAALAAALVVAVAGMNLFLPGGGLGLPQVSPTPMPTPRGTLVVGDVVPLPAGTYVTADDFLVRVTFTVPADWDGHLGGPYLADLGRQYGPGAVLISIFDKLYADPCQYKGLLDPSPGPSVDDLATALASVPGLNATTPTDVTFAGYQGKQLTLTAPASFDACTLSPEGTFQVWQLPLGGNYEMAPGQHDRVWILDVDGQRIVISAIEAPGQSPQDKADVQGILDSIRLAPIN